FFFQAEDGIRDLTVTGVQTCALPISGRNLRAGLRCVVDHVNPFVRRVVLVGGRANLGVPTEERVARGASIREVTAVARAVGWSRSEERRVGKECRGRWGRRR